MHARSTGVTPARAVPARMQTWGKTFDYCLLVDLDAGRRIERRRALREPYSGYLWECVSPRDVARRQGGAGLVDAFFVWEHTDFASPGGARLRARGAAAEARYVEQRFGELELIQKSAPIVPGVPRLASESFLDLAAHGSV